MTNVNGWLIEVFPHTKRLCKIISWTTVLRKNGRVVNLRGHGDMQPILEASIAWANQN